MQGEVLFESRLSLVSDGCLENDNQIIEWLGSNDTGHDHTNAPQQAELLLETHLCPVNGIECSSGRQLIEWLISDDTDTFHGQLDNMQEEVLFEVQLCPVSDMTLEDKTEMVNWLDSYYPSNDCGRIHLEPAQILFETPLFPVTGTKPDTKSQVEDWLKDANPDGDLQSSAPVKVASESDLSKQLLHILKQREQRILDLLESLEAEHVRKAAESKADAAEQVVIAAKILSTTTVQAIVFMPCAQSLGPVLIAFAAEVDISRMGPLRLPHNQVFRFTAQIVLGCLLICLPWLAKSLPAFNRTRTPAAHGKLPLVAWQAEVDLQRATVSWVTGLMTAVANLAMGGMLSSNWHSFLVGAVGVILVIGISQYWAEEVLRQKLANVQKSERKSSIPTSGNASESEASFRALFDTYESLAYLRALPMIIGPLTTTACVMVSWMEGLTLAQLSVWPWETLNESLKAHLVPSVISYVTLGYGLAQFAEDRAKSCKAETIIRNELERRRRQRELPSYEQVRLEAELETVKSTSKQLVKILSQSLP
ncbi:hypothetical protein EHS25_003604 [Saitozyma podzolica]|uniref:Uncharacterized protein n=1 Tax=Saitozyma podzolica TaxID=1890683 RepID=A0A427Y7N7_9TREE|nr:hypothetical protein EHS25_003604 [Saitozyma podzolica]